MALVRKAMQTSCGARPKSAHGRGGEKGEYVSEESDDSDEDMESGEMRRLWKMDTGDIEEEQNPDTEMEENK